MKKTIAIVAMLIASTVGEWLVVFDNISGM